MKQNMRNETLYNDLYILREKLRMQNPGDNICSDKALEFLAVRQPRYKSELTIIEELGRGFVDKYGEAFMSVLNKYNNKGNSNIISSDVLQTLKNYENRLVNINKKNKLLYCPKISAKNGFDLFESEATNIEDFILGNGNKSITLISSLDQKDKLKTEKRKHLNNLIREVNTTFRETGRFELYIGYPFVEGNVGIEDFPIRAPLVLFPVTIESNLTKAVIKKDTKRDILYNSNLILSFYKLAKSNDKLPDMVIEKIEEDFIGQVLNFYKSVGIEIKKDCFNEFGPFINYTAEEFKNNVAKELQIKNNAVLGKFALCSSAIQADIKKIIESNNINDLVKDLLTDVTDIDIYSESNNNQKIKPKPFNESNIFYINDLDYAQESALVNIQNRKEMVLQGPPGTGKSQTITSIIIDSVCKGKNVLMVSQKKAALDVIYSRLGNLSKYAVLIADMKDKSDFYEQVGKAIFSDKPVPFKEDSYLQLGNGIDNNLTYLKVIGDALKSDTEFGVPMYEVYQHGFDNFFIQNENEFARYSHYLSNNMIGASYDEIQKAYHVIDNKGQFNDFKQYTSLILSYPFLGSIKTDLNVLSLANLNNDLNQIIVGEKKILKGFKLKKAIQNLMKKYFNTKLKYKEFVPYLDILQDGIKCYNDFLKCKSAIESLSVNERFFLNNVLSLVRTEALSEKDANKRMYDLIIYYHISNFESRNRSVNAGIRDYRSLISLVSKDLKEKKELTKNKFVNYMDKIYDSNAMYQQRLKEVQRSVEALKQMSVNRFIEKHSFELFSNIKIWLMTPEVVSEALPLDNGLFDLVIFDEASQLYVEKGIPAIQRGKQILIAGDHKQLRPSSLGFGRLDYDDSSVEDKVEFANDTAALEEESLLDLARFKYPEMMLNFHYRSKYAELINFSNYAFYKGNLNISPNLEQPHTPPIEVIKVNNGYWENRCNKEEAKKVVSLLKEFLLTRRNEESIGIITFNVNQRDLIDEYIEDECRKDENFAKLIDKEFNRKKDGEDYGLFIKNIENVQGDERDCIIFSITYAKEKDTDKVVRNYGWLNQRGGENRLNVAITRAKRKIYVVKSIEADEMNVDNAANDGPKYFKKYLKYCEYISSGDEEGAQQILLYFGDYSKQIDIENDEFIDNVYDSLKQAGLDIVKHVGIGNYRLDIGIKKKGKYVMGIECDSSKLWSLESIRERDIHRKKYLESRGWFVYRIWAMNWYHLKKEVIDGVVDYVKNIK